jgi:hypothetical protein
MSKLGPRFDALPETEVRGGPPNGRKNEQAQRTEGRKPVEKLDDQT